MGPAPDLPTVDVSVVLPTLNEGGPLRALAERIDAGRAPYRSEVLVVDDGSADGTVEFVRQWAIARPVRLIERVGRRGLASAVLEGCAAARGRVLVVMDADGSHDPAAIPSLVDPVLSGAAEFVLGSRNVPGGSSEGLSRVRRRVSWGAALLARPLTAVRDPMSGFFAFSAPLLRRAPLAPVGYKIGLEILVKATPDPVLEVPIRFAPRLAGESKLGGVQIGGYVRHLARLYRWRLFHPARRSPRRAPPAGGPGPVSGP